MSEIKVNSIKGVGASAAAITVNNSDGTCTANLSNRQGKNLIINGAQLIAQRGTSSTTNGYGSVDRFLVQYSGTNEAPTQSQVDVASGTTPYTLGFRKALKVTNGDQSGGAGSSDYIEIGHKIEAQDMANSGWNYTNTNSKITLSFWVKSSIPQNFYGYIRTRDGTAQNFCIETGSLSQNIWTKITKVIPGNSNLQFNTDTTTNAVDKGLEIYFTLFMGTDLTNNKSLNSWAAFDGTNHSPDQTPTWYTTNDATFEMTGVQLEVGSVATDFEHRSFGQELALCQRYYNKYLGPRRYPYINGHNANKQGFLNFQYSVKMRTTPTVTFGSAVYIFSPQISVSHTVEQATAIGVDGFTTIQWPNQSGLGSHGDAKYGMLLAENNANSFIETSAEL
tara:strand:- start:209 stop:1384 length:1176 start_codon:yes stop_codon:yes gene_type:complete